MKNVMTIGGQRAIIIYDPDIEMFRFVLRVTPEVHEDAATAAAASGESLNQWVAGAIKEAARA